MKFVRKAEIDMSLIRNVFFALLVIAVLIALVTILTGKIRPYAADLPRQLLSLFLG
jgi:hypothetical protein